MTKLIIFFISLIAFNPLVHAYTDAISLERDGFKVVLLGEHHAHDNDKENRILIKTFSKFSTQSHAPKKDALRNATFYFEHETQTVTTPTVLDSEASNFFFQMKDRFQNPDEGVYFIPFEPRATNSRSSSSLEGFMANLESFVLNNIPMTWNDFQTICKKNAIDFKTISLKSFLKERKTLIEQIDLSPDQFLANDFNYLVKLQTDLLKHRLHTISHMQPFLTKENMIVNLLTWMNQETQRTQLSLFLEVYQNIAIKLDQAIFDYGFLRELLAIAQTQPHRSVILFSGRNHTLALKKHLIHLGFKEISATAPIVRQVEVEPGLFIQASIQRTPIDLEKIIHWALH